MLGQLLPENLAVCFRDHGQAVRKTSGFTVPGDIYESWPRLISVSKSPMSG